MIPKITRTTTALTIKSNECFYLFAGKGNQNGHIGKKTKNDNCPIHEDEAILSHGSYPGDKHEYIHPQIYEY